MFDEVITGFGRLGHWFAADRYGVVPDLTTFAKAVTSGYQPLGGVFVGAGRAAGRWRPTPPTSSATVTRTPVTRRRAPPGWPTWRSSSARGWSARAGTIGPRLGAGLEALAADGVIDHARGDGAVWAAGLRADQDAMAIRDRMLADGVITRAIGTDTLTFCPPLVITEEQVDRIVDVLATAVRLTGRSTASASSASAIARRPRRHQLGELVVAGRVAVVEPVAQPVDEVGAGRAGRPLEDHRVVVDVRAAGSPGRSR